MKKSKAKKVASRKVGKPPKKKLKKAVTKKTASHKKSSRVAEVVSAKPSKSYKAYHDYVIPPIPEKPSHFVPVPKKALAPTLSEPKLILKPMPAKKTPLINDKDAEKLGTVESALFDSRMPMNCTVPICGQPAFRKDVDQRMWCEDHRDRGRWK